MPMPCDASQEQTDAMEEARAHVEGLSKSLKAGACSKNPKFEG